MDDFKPIPGFEGRYSISSQGQVYSHLRDKLLRPSLTLDGYPQVILYGGGRARCTRRVHRLVAETFIGSIDGLEVHHLDGDLSNPSLENLQIVTRRTHRELDMRGELHHNAKLDESAVKMIRNAPQILFSEYLGRIFGVNESTVRDVRNGRSWTHV
jgi:hypothetical protein